MVMVYYSEKIQSKIIQGQRSIGQSPGRFLHMELPVVLSQWNCGQHRFPQQQCVTKQMECY